MKQFFSIIIMLMLGLSSHAQNNAIGADDNFMELLIQMGPELRAPKNIGSWPMLQNLDVPIDNKLAYKYLWQENNYVKEEEANCNNIGFMLNKETNVATLFFYKGKADNLFFLIDVQTYNYKTGKMIDQLLSVAGFNDKGAACNMQINSFNEIVFKTLANGEENTVTLEIGNKGKIKK
jgi:hypothetical protein